jgi:hypothetical protein
VVGYSKIALNTDSWSKVNSGIHRHVLGRIGGLLAEGRKRWLFTYDFFQKVLDHTCADRLQEAGETATPLKGT